MSYSSRVYRQRNPKVQEEKKGKAFFPGKESQKEKGSKSFFQAKGNAPEDSSEKQADMVAGQVINNMQTKHGFQRKEENVVRRQAADQPDEKVLNNANPGEKEKEKTVQKKMADQEKEREMNIPRQGEPLKEKETTIQKKAEDDKKDIKKKSEPVEEKDKDKPGEKT